MEDEDGESKSMDMWNILGEQRIKDSVLGNSLTHSIDDVYADAIEKEKQLLRSIVAKDSPGKHTVARQRFMFKGLKKRILTQARDAHTIVPKSSTLEQQHLTRSNASPKSSRDRRIEGKRERKITEYAQYLGLQPSSRSKCSKCHGWSNCSPNTKQNLCSCNPNMTPMPSTSDSTTSLPPHAASNFKITRKVYLCAACGTYFENWNLFLHMRDIHKRHICLFCLGMFGQAERLSYHLLKKHSVPEMMFTSVEDFYSVFKGSCYLVCCSCERVFSETDNFYNHFCSPALKQDTTAGMSVCTLCRQTGTHASTCSFALSSDTDKESCAATSLATVTTDLTRADDTSPAAVLPSERTTNLGGKGLPRKAIKNNRTKHAGEDGVVQNSHQQKSNALVRKLGTRIQCNESQPYRDPDVPQEVANNQSRDTVSETIMEVSRYTGDSSDENDENDEQAMNKDVSRDRGSEEKSSVQNRQVDSNEAYDSVTETIMEVSRCMSDTEGEDTNEKVDVLSPYLANAHTSHVAEKIDNEEDEAMSDKSDIDPSHLASPRTFSPVRWEADETTMSDKRTATCKPGIESGSQSYDSPQNVRSRSPINRSLFSPRHESHILDPQSKESETHFEDHVNRSQEEEEEEEEEKRPAAPSVGESQVSVSFNAVASTDRSLVIKICTNRNSQFSVATATTVSRESEENNNAAEGSTSKENIANGSDREGNIIDDDPANDLDDSDSDSDKLAVVDSNPEEDEDVEDVDEVDEVDEVEETEEGQGDTLRIGNQENSSGIEIGTFAIAETALAGGDAAEKFSDNGIDGTKTTIVNEQEAKSCTISDGDIALAGEDVPCVDLNVEGTLDSMELEDLLKRCIDAASPICVYCNHARHIAVNGKQLGLHMLAEHKFQPQHPAIIIHAEQFTARVKRSLDELETRYFNLSTYNSANGTYNVPEVRMYECFHCRFHSAVHKELYLHNRKMHQKTILICIMCKSTFHSYSELLCHLCPGVYSPNINVRYRCCMCSVASLPSAFRLMVHLRKRHHACDVCLESTGNQQRLSNHVWKHKLNHLCYRCGIAYRNKPDITKHLFWKHGTESVLCKKCLQKKWPHIYHFCIPPTAFVCEECGSSFSRAVALKVHKRLHSGDMPYSCDECAERFISRKLLAKHQASHREPEPEDVDVNVTDVVDRPATDGSDEKFDKDKIQRTMTTATDGVTAGPAIESVKDAKETVKRVVDVYDLPPLNLSSESDTDGEEEKIASTEKTTEKEKLVAEDTANKSEATEEAVDDVTVVVNDIVDVERNEEEKKQEARIMDGIWDNFKTYAASLEMKESAKNFVLKESEPEIDLEFLRSVVLADHDYHIVSTDQEKSEEQATTSKDDARQEHDAKSHRSPSPSNAESESDVNKRAKVKTPKKRKRSIIGTSSSDSSSDTDSSSCSCGTNCSCSSNSSSGSSSSSSSSSDSDSSTSESSPRKQSSRKDRNKKEREIAHENKADSVEPESKEKVTIENGPMPDMTSEPALPTKQLLRESDLETEETDTDEDFYDEYPQLLANKLFTEKHNQSLLLPTVAPTSVSTPMSATVMVEQTSTPLNNGVSNIEMTIPEPTTMTIDDRPQQKKKTKTKKRRKGERAKHNVTTVANTVESIKLNISKVYCQANTGFAASSPVVPSTLQSSRSSTPGLPVTYNDFHGISGGSNTAMEILQTPSAIVPSHQNQNVIGSGSEAENKRSSKRKRVPKRFYGDSSDEEPQEKQHIVKWGRKTETITPAFIPPPSMSMPMSMPMTPNPKPIPPPPRLPFSSKIAQTYRTVQMEPARQQTLTEQTLAITPASATESEGAAGSSSESSESEAEDSVSQRTCDNLPPADNAPSAERPVKIYCYCRCPYDEVSEMIACDGEDCRIEWFHFECVGIMVPPKGKWYCPDCRPKHGIVQNNDECCD